MTTANLNESKVIVVTGANRGIGRGILEAAARAGYRVIAHARRPEDAEQSTDRARQLGGESVAVSGDLTDPELPARLVATAEETFGESPAAVVFCAGVLGPKTPVGSIDTAVFDDVMAINVNAQFALTRALLPGMLAAGRGVLVYLTSGLGRFALPGYGVYTVSKHAVEGLAKQVAEDYREAGLVSVCVAPGMVQTEMLKAALESDDVSAYTTPERCGEGFRRLIEDLLGSRGGELSGRSLDIDGWLPE